MNSNNTLNSRITLYSLVALLCSLFTGCEDNGSSYPPDTSKQVTITQGVWGNVWFLEGNFQPIEGRGTISPVQCQILIYEATPLDSVSSAGAGFYRDIRTKQVAITASNRTGFFQLALPVGMYSAFIKIDTLYWGGEDDSIGIYGFMVLPGSVTKVQININYRAAW
jgi:hypothetical protein